MLNKTKYFGINITTDPQKNILEYVIKSIKNRDKFYIVTPNPELVVIATHDKEYRDVLNQARISLPDGAGLVIASGIMGNPIQERITGVDFMQDLCKEASENALSIGLLGAGSGIAERAAECLKKSYPNLKISYISEEWGGIKNGKWQIANGKNKSDAISHKQDTDVIDILFVAFGSPKQEKWIYENLDKLPIRVAMGVGGAFDFISGNVRRAPFLIRFLGFEWLYRLIREPWRFRRQLALLEFVKIVFRERFGKK